MSSKKSMGMDYRKLFSFAVIFMFAFAFSVPFVMAANGDEEAGDLGIGNPFAGLGEDGFLSGVGDFFNDWENGETSGAIAKYFFWALVTMLVFSVASKIPGLQGLFVKNGKNSFLGFLFSALVGFLAMWAIPIGQVRSMMLSYGAMGFVMGAFLPFIILMFFTISLAQSRGSVSQKVVSKFIAMGIWIIFTIWIFARAGGIRADNPEASIVLEIVIGVASIAVTLAMTTIFKKIREMLKIETVESARTNAELARTGRDINRGDAEAAANAGS